MMEEKKSIIDEHYGEKPMKPIIDEEGIKDDLVPSLAQMDLLKEMDFTLDINPMEIVSRGAAIADKKRLKYELVGFIVACLSIIAIILFVILKINLKVFLYTQAALTYLLPLIILPATIRARRDNS